MCKCVQVSQWLLPLEQFRQAQLLLWKFTEAVYLSTHIGELYFLLSTSNLLQLYTAVFGSLIKAFVCVVLTPTLCRFI